MSPRKFQSDGQYFLFLLPVFFLLHGFTQNYGLIPLAGCLVLLIKYLVATAAFTGLLYLFIRSWRTAAMMAFAVMCFHFFFGAIHDSLKSWFPNSFLVKYVFLIPGFFILFLALFFYLRRKKPASRKLARYLNVLFLALIVIDGVQLAIKAANYKDDFGIALNAGLTNCDSCKKPDVYLIIADEYAGSRELSDILHFDNSPFENELRKRGFHIVDSSQSNYNYTPFSMASILSIDYLRALEGKNKSVNDRNLCYRTINSNAVAGFFKMNGYEMKNCSIFRFADKLPYASTAYYQTGMDLVTAQTFLSRVDRDIRFNTVTRFKIKSEIERAYYFNLHLNDTLYKETWKLAEIQSQTPRFIYTHLEMPHYPYYVDRNGKLRDLESVTNQEKNISNLNNYVEYLQYCNGRFLSLIDHIFSHSKKPPIIIFMGDHGFRQFRNDSVDHKYHFMNFNSVYLPGNNYDDFYKGMSNVNLFRVILNKQFGQHLPLLKDSTSFLKEQ